MTSPLSCSPSLRNLPPHSRSPFQLLLSPQQPPYYFSAVPGSFYQVASDCSTPHARPVLSPLDLLLPPLHWSVCLQHPSGHVSLLHSALCHLCLLPVPFSSAQKLPEVRDTVVMPSLSHCTQGAGCSHEFHGSKHREAGPGPCSQCQLDNETQLLMMTFNLQWDKLLCKVMS